MKQYYDRLDHMEFVAEFKDGGRDWIDPVVSIEETDSSILVTNFYINENVYVVPKDNLEKWTVRPYGRETTYNPI